MWQILIYVWGNQTPLKIATSCAKTLDLKAVFDGPILINVA